MAAPWQQEIGERSFAAYLRAQRVTDAELRRALRLAAAEAGRLAETLGGDGIGVVVRRQQYLAAQAQLNAVQAQLWQDVTGAVRRGYAPAIAAATDGNLALLHRLGQLGDAATGLLATFESGARYSYKTLEARLRNNISLSDAVYKNQALATRRVDAIINNGILTRKSAREIARDVRAHIRPGTPGGTSYAAMRLGRTELNNAFHSAGILAAQPQPWVTQMEWHLSGSHPRPDTCDGYAAGGPYDIDDVPSKPHPQCLCYTTPVTVDPQVFNKQLRNGDYDNWLIDNGQAPLADVLIVEVVP